MANLQYQHLALRVKLLSAIAFKIARQDFEKRLKKESIGISPLALVVMRIIRQEHCTIQYLSKQLMIAPASLVPIIDSLERKGLVKRSSDPKDRRKTPLALTSKGEVLFSRFQSLTKDGLLVKSISKLGDKKSLQLIGLLEELTNILSGDKEICKKIERVSQR
jgi:DNA-binding MarR family transcriptional regulator